MTLEQFTRLAEDEFAFGWPLKEWNPRFTVVTAAHAGIVSVRLRFDTPHRETGVKAPFMAYQCLDYFLVGQLQREGALRWLRKVVLDAVVHELDESIMVGGERVFDPHRRQDG